MKPKKGCRHGTGAERKKQTLSEKKYGRNNHPDREESSPAKQNVKKEGGKGQKTRRKGEAAGEEPALQPEKKQEAKADVPAHNGEEGRRGDTGTTRGRRKLGRQLRRRKVKRPTERRRRR